MFSRFARSFAPVLVALRARQTGATLSFPRVKLNWLVMSRMAKTKKKRQKSPGCSILNPNRWIVDLLKK